MLLCSVEANKLCTINNNTNSSSCNKAYFDPEMEDIWVLAFFECFSQFLNRYWGEIWSAGRCCDVCSCQFVRFWWGLCLCYSASVAFSGRVRGFGFETVSLCCGHFPRFFWSLSIACYCLNDLLRRGGGEEWLHNQCILREVAGGGRSLGLIWVVVLWHGVALVVEVFVNLHTTALLVIKCMLTLSLYICKHWKFGFFLTSMLVKLGN